jgi:hypothetical protein
MREDGMAAKAIGQTRPAVDWPVPAANRVRRRGTGGLQSISGVNLISRRCDWFDRTVCLPFERLSADNNVPLRKANDGFMKENRTGGGYAGFSRAQLMAVATAVPSHCEHQSTIAAAANGLFAHRFAGYARIARVFETCGIHKRHMIKPLDWYQTQLGWAERMAAYLEGAQDLFVAASEKASTVGQATLT